MSREADIGGLSVRRTLVGAACLGLQPLLLNLLSVPAMAYIIHRMGAERYAHWAAAVAVLGLFSLIANLGLRSAYIRAIAARPGSVAEALAEQISLRLALTAPAGVLIVGTCLLMGYPAPVLRCAGIAVVGLALTTAATTLADTLQSFHRIKTLAAVNLAAGLALTGASVFAAWRRPSAEWMATAYLMGPLVSCVLAYGAVRRHVCRVELRWSPGRFVRLLRDSRYFAAQQLLILGSNQAEGLISPRLIGMVAFGNFAAGATIGNRLVVLPDALCAAAYPTMVRAFSRDRRSGGRVVLRYLLVAIAAGVAVGACVSAVAGWLGSLLLPAQSELFAFVVRVTIWSVPLIGVECVLGYGLNAAGREAVQAKLALPAAALSLGLSVALVLLMGVEGACWSMMARPALRAAFLTPAAVRAFWSRAGERAMEPAWVELRRAG